MAKIIICSAFYYWLMNELGVLVSCWANLWNGKNFPQLVPYMLSLYLPCLCWCFTSQLGHLRTDDKTISSPKLVTSLADKKIRSVSTTNASIVVMTENGDVIAIQDFTSKRILSTKTFDVVKMAASGGHLDPKVVPNSNLVCLIIFCAEVKLKADLVRPANPIVFVCGHRPKTKELLELLLFFFLFTFWFKSSFK